MSLESISTASRLETQEERGALDSKGPLEAESSYADPCKGSMACCCPPASWSRICFTQMLPI